jgi:hypothetical protein
VQHSFTPSGSVVEWSSILRFAGTGVHGQRYIVAIRYLVHVCIDRRHFDCFQPTDDAASGFIHSLAVWLVLCWNCSGVYSTGRFSKRCVGWAYAPTTVRFLINSVMSVSNPLFDYLYIKAHFASYQCDDDSILLSQCGTAQHHRATRLVQHDEAFLALIRLRVAVSRH